MANRPLRNELTRILLIKLLLLLALWWVWVRDAQVTVDADGAGARLLSAEIAHGH